MRFNTDTLAAHVESSRAAVGQVEARAAALATDKRRWRGSWRRREPGRRQRRRGSAAPVSTWPVCCGAWGCPRKCQRGCSQRRLFCSSSSSSPRRSRGRRPSSRRSGNRSAKDSQALPAPLGG